MAVIIQKHEVTVGQKIAVFQPLGYVYVVEEIRSPKEIVANYTDGWDRIVLTQKKDGKWLINGWYEATIKWSVQDNANGQDVYGKHSKD